MKNTKIYLLKRDNPISIFIVIACAMIGYTSAYVLLSGNYLHEDRHQYISSIRSETGNKVSEVMVDTLSPSQKKMLQPTVVIWKEKVLFHRNPVFLVWSTLIMIMMTIAAASFPVFIWQIKQIREKFRLQGKHLLQATGIALFIIVFLVIMQLSLKGFYDPSQMIDNFRILLRHGWVVRSIAMTTLLLQVPVLIVIFLVGISAGRIEADVRNRQSIETALSGFSMLNQVLTSALQVLAIVVVFSVLTTGALQQSVKSALEITRFDIFPREASYVYGMFFSLFLGIVYMPTFLFLKNRYGQFRQNLEKETDSLDEEKKEWYKNISGSLNFGGSALDNLKLALTVLAPLLTSFLPEQLRNLI